MRLANFVILTLLLVVAVSSSFYVLLKSINTLEIREIQTRIEIANYIGFDLDNESLAFGTIFPGGRARRNLNITNYFDEDALVRIKINGEMDTWVHGYEDAFFLGPNESRDFTFAAEPPDDTPIGKYNSTILISFYRT